MHVVVTAPEGDREVSVSLRNPEATLRDLLQAVLGRDAPELVAIGDRVVPSWWRVADSGLYEGAVLHPEPERLAADAGGPRSPPCLATVTGPDAGRVRALATGPTSIGRDPGNDLALSDETISREHAVLVLDEHGRGTITDLGSANGTLVDGVALHAHEPSAVGPGSLIELGGIAVAVRVDGGEDRPRGLDPRRHVGPAGAIAFNRPPRLARAVEPPALAVPEEPSEPPKPQFSVASTLGPLAIAVVMVLVSGDPRFALFSLLSPLVGIGSYAESRRRSSRSNARARERYGDEIAKLARRLGEARALELARRRERLPDPAEVLRRASLPSVRLWERRPGHDDFLHLFAGLGDVAFTPPLDGRARELPPKLAPAAEDNRLHAAPVGVELSDGGVVGIVGDRSQALAAARSLVCQAAVHHGPADLTIGVFVDEGRDPDWEWSKWLPHTAADGDERWLSGRRDRSEALLRQLRAGAGTGTVLAVLDSDVLTEGRDAPARELLQGGAARSAEDRQARAGIVIASSQDRLPAACNTVIELAGPDADAVVHGMHAPAEGQEIVAAGLSVASARACARDLARFEDPELRQAGAGLPDGVRLLPLLELDGVGADAIRQRWRAGTSARVAAPVGVTERGVFTLDLERDGPHGLVGGTTGSGKSELLRSLIAALAANADPRQLTFLLMDFKGGAAFDACARLPHTVGMVTDLDEGLVERALRSLDAELQYRERLLRSVGADNLRDYQERDHPEPLPRLVVVIDEFAKMARELPELLSALVDVAQRGRTLGVHLILATQRPAGVINDHIRTNTNLRIALRVQDAADSVDVIGERAAAELSRHRPGRAYVRLGPDEIVPIQSALITCVTDAATDAPVDVAPFQFGAGAGERDRATGEVLVPGADRPSDLARLVDSIVEANDAEGIAPPRRPWPEPLPEHIDLAELLPAAEAGRALVALADEPRRQAQYPAGWELEEGNLLLLGIPGSGTTTALAGLALGLAGAQSPERLELYALDSGAGDLAALEALPHVGSVVLAGDRERQTRLIRWLRAELDRRRTDRGHTTTVVLVDNLAALRAEFDDVAGQELMDELGRVYADGPQAGIHFAVAADRPNTVPTAWTAVTTQKWLFRLPDPYDYVTLGLNRRDVPRATPGRAVMADSGVHIQIGQPGPSLAAEVAARWAGATPAAAPIRVLPAGVALGSLGAVGELRDEPWRIPIGVRESDLEPGELVLYDGEHAIVAGPARSGKSQALWTIAESLAGAPGRDDATIVALAGRRSPLRDCRALDHVATGGDAAALLARLRTADGPVVLLVDDAEGFDDADGAIAGLLAAGRPGLHVIAAARADALRSLYGHWTSDVRRSKVGLLLRPDVDFDGDLLGAALPRRAPVPLTVGRGYLVHNGESEIVQVATPADMSADGPPAGDLARVIE